MSTPHAHFSGRERGQSLVELAISLMVILLLVAGAVTFGMAFFSYVAIRDAAQEGALFGSINPCVLESDGTCHRNSQVNVAAIRQRVRASSTNPVDLSKTSVVPDAYMTVTATTTQPCEGSDAAGDPNAIQVTVEYDYPVFMPLLGALSGQNIHLTATVTDTILEPRCPPSP